MNDSGEGHVQWGIEVKWADVMGGHLEQVECHDEQEARTLQSRIQRNPDRIKSNRLIKRHIGPWEPVE